MNVSRCAPCTIGDHSRCTKADGGGGYCECPRDHGPCDHDWRPVGTYAMPDGCTHRFERCARCGAQQTITEDT